MGAVNFAAIRAAKLKVERVEVPDWGGAVNLRQLSGTEREEWEERSFAAKKSGEKFARASLVALCMRDDAGSRIVGDDDIPALSEAAGDVLDALFERCLKLNRLGKDEFEAAVKNCETGPSAGCCSASPTAPADEPSASSATA